MIGMACPFRHDQHRVIHPEIEDWLKREVPGSASDLLFVYRHLLYNTFVIAMWTSPGKQSFVDVMNLGGSLQTFTREKARNLKQMLSDSYGESGSETAKRLKGAESDRVHSAQDENDDTERWNDWITRTKTHVSFAGSTK